MELKVVHLQHLSGALSVKLMPLPAEVPPQLTLNVGECKEATFHFVEKSGPVHVYQEVGEDAQSRPGLMGLDVLRGRPPSGGGDGW